MTDQHFSPALSPAEAVAERIETRRAAANPARHPEAPAGAATPPVCDGWGLVPVLGLDGEYESSACLGCALCSTVREPIRQADPFARLPVPSSDEIW